MNPNEEKTLRESIRLAIRAVKNKRQNIVNEQEDKLRQIIREFMKIEENTPDVDPTPNKSTGINVLEQLLKKIIPILEEDYKSLTTNESQRSSYRAHIVNAVENSLTPAIMNNEAGDEEGDLEEVIDIDVGRTADNDKFIDIRTPAEKSADDAEKQEDPKDMFGKGIDGDETGRNMAYESYKKIETNVIDSYELLSDPEDQELFYDYLIANLKMYFNKFEEELSPEVPEPTNKAYDMAQQDKDDQTQEPGEMSAPDDAIELDI
jgi:hypothetical protein|tara:strand:+ start:4125 stop:4913 length:789 start_codon:yes stop_codon:yes gene_type:complete